MFYLEGGNAITCPKCKKQWDVRWDTEYGDPIFGQHDAVCPSCGEKFTFGCYFEYTQNYLKKAKVK